MKANPTKFQLTVFNENVTKCINSADNVQLKPKQSVNLLGVLSYLLS